VTDDVEQELGRMLRKRVADLPASHDVAPATVARVHRRRAVKFGAFAAAVLVVVAGTAAAVAQTRPDDTHHLTAAAPTTTTRATTSVPTVVCPILYAVTPDLTYPTPLPVPRQVSVPTGGDLDSFAAATDDRFVVLGPRGGTCTAQTAADGQFVMRVRSATSDGAYVSIVDDFLWHGGVGSALACSVSDNPAVTDYVAQNFSRQESCPKSGRTLTRVDSNTTTYADADGTRGAGWIRLPSSSNADDGKVSVLTCRPGDGLSVADCDVIISDWIARVDVPISPTTTTTTTTPPAGTVPQFGCAGTHTEGAELPPAAPRAGDPSLYPGLANYQADLDGDPRFTVLGPRGWTCSLRQYQDGRAAVVVAKAADSTEAAAPIAIDQDWLWHGGVGSLAACTVFGDPAVVQYVTQNFPDLLPCPKPTRHVTRTAANVATFVDDNGTRGAAWIRLPTSAGDGHLSLLTCRPNDELSVAQCDTIVADYAARADAPAAPGP